MTAFRQATELKKTIEARKPQVFSTIVAYVEYAKSLRDAVRDLRAKEKKYIKNINKKNEHAYDVAELKFDGYFALVRENYIKLNSIVAGIEEDWAEIARIIGEEKPKMAKKELEALKKFMNEVNDKKLVGDTYLLDGGIDMASLDMPLPVALDAIEEVEEPAEEEVAEEAPVEEPAEEPAVEEAPAEEPAAEEVPAEEPAKAAPALTLAPISIDISTTVERTVAQAMDKFSAALEKKLADYMKTLELAVPEFTASASGVSTAAKESAELQAKIAEDESYLLDKLVALVEQLKGLNTSIVGVSSDFAFIGNSSC